MHSARSKWWTIKSGGVNGKHSEMKGGSREPRESDHRSSAGQCGCGVYSICSERLARVRLAKNGLTRKRIQRIVHHLEVHVHIHHEQKKMAPGDDRR